MIVKQLQGYISAEWGLLILYVYSADNKLFYLSKDLKARLLSVVDMNTMW